MARQMKAVTAPRTRDDVLVIAVDPLKVGRGHRVLPRGGLHGSGKRPGRSRDKRSRCRETADGRGAA